MSWPSQQSPSKSNLIRASGPDHILDVPFHAALFHRLRGPNKARTFGHYEDGKQGHDEGPVGPTNVSGMTRVCVCVCVEGLAGRQNRPLNLRQACFQHFAMVRRKARATVFSSLPGPVCSATWASLFWLKRLGGSMSFRGACSLRHWALVRPSRCNMGSRAEHASCQLASSIAAQHGSIGRHKDFAVRILVLSGVGGSRDIACCRGATTTPCSRSCVGSGIER